MSDQGDHHLRLFGGSVDWERGPLISRLFSLYQGTVVTPGKRNKPQVRNKEEGENTAGSLSSRPVNVSSCVLSLQSAPQEHRSPVTLRVRLRIMPYLLKSTLAANSFPACMQVFTPIPLVSFQYHTHTAWFPFHWLQFHTIHTNWVIFILQVVFDSLFGEITNTKLRSLTLQFIYRICSRYTNAHMYEGIILPTSSFLLLSSFLLPCSTSEQKLTVMAPVLLTGLNKIVDQPEEVSVEGVRSGYVTRPSLVYLTIPLFNQCWSNF